MMRTQNPALTSQSDVPVFDAYELMAGPVQLILDDPSVVDPLEDGVLWKDVPFNSGLRCPDTEPRAFGKGLLKSSFSAFAAFFQLPLDEKRAGDSKEAPHSRGQDDVSQDEEEVTH